MNNQNFQPQFQNMFWILLKFNRKQEILTSYFLNILEQTRSPGACLKFWGVVGADRGELAKVVGVCLSWEQQADVWHLQRLWNWQRSPLETLSLVFQSNPPDVVRVGTASQYWPFLIKQFQWIIRRKIRRYPISLPS